MPGQHTNTPLYSVDQEDKTMTVKEIITLAMQGYKPGDIKELIELAKDIPEPAPAPEPEPIPEPAPAPEPAAPEFDYAAEIEKLKAENDRIKNDLQKAQEFNRTASTPEVPKKSNQETINDMFLSLTR